MVYKFIDTPRGARLLMINGFTFTKICHRSYMWCCSNRSKNCKAKVRVNADNTICYVNTNHNHKAPEYYTTKGGFYVKV